ncbi:hypothetical protein CDD81_2211 [Ophiocordyceps australis]|uniref:Uncharacterized protein n=1 Tax=Ophiocordyceps australis TaxID=1399860 RepID=A0A2C5XU82_9HYPO|nr:hypothetical protein CDD81_2211 [Ophiocordyceps australis]
MMAHAGTRTPEMSYFNLPLGPAPLFYLALPTPAEQKDGLPPPPPPSVAWPSGVPEDCSVPEGLPLSSAVFPQASCNKTPMASLPLTPLPASAPTAAPSLNGPSFGVDPPRAARQGFE